MNQTNDSLAKAERLKLADGSSGNAVYRMVERALAEFDFRGEICADLGCGRGALWPLIQSRFPRCIGLDVVEFDGLPKGIEYRYADLDVRLSLADGEVDVTFALESMPSLESPRAMLREMVRVTKPGGWVLVTQPNVLSLLSLLTLLRRGQFNSFQENTAAFLTTPVIEEYLRRAASAAGLQEIAIRYSLEGRAPFTARTMPGFVSRLWPRSFSDNMLLLGRVPIDPTPR